MKILLVAREVCAENKEIKLSKVLNTALDKYRKYGNEIDVISLDGDIKGWFANKTEGKTVGGKVQDGNFFLKNATYLMGSGKAYVELSEVAGKDSTMIKDPAFTTSYGLGQQILQAVKLGSKEIIVDMRGGVTNDGGAGLLSALGIKFINEKGEEFIPTGGTLKEIKSIRLDEINPKVKNVKFVGICNKLIPLTGERGCSMTTAQYKGAKKEERRKELEENMRHFCEKLKECGVEVAEENGLGAGGGMGLAIKSVLDGSLIEVDEYELANKDFAIRERNSEMVIFVNTNRTGDLTKYKNISIRKGNGNSEQGYGNPNNEINTYYENNADEEIIFETVKRVEKLFSEKGC